MENKTQISGEQGILNESSILNIFASSFFFWGGVDFKVLVYFYLESGFFY